MSFDTHWNDLVATGGIWTETDRRIAKLFYNFGQFDTATKVREALYDPALDDKIAPPPIQGVSDE